MYHKAMNTQDLSFILDNILDQCGKLTHSTDNENPVEIIDAYFYRHCPFCPVDVTMFENTVCGDCGSVIHAGACACGDRSFDVDTNYHITARYIFGDATYSIKSKDSKEVFHIEILSSGETSGKKNTEFLTEEECFHIFYNILRDATFNTEKEYNTENEEL